MEICTIFNKTWLVAGRRPIPAATDIQSIADRSGRVLDAIEDLASRKGGVRDAAISMSGRLGKSANTIPAWLHWAQTKTQ